LPLLALLWHGFYIAWYVHPHYLFFVCYTANLLLGIGIFVRSALLIGAGFGWTVIALPLWLYDTVLNSGCETSCAFFHLCGVIVGGMAMPRYRLPRHTWCVALGIGLALQFIARMFTDESLNINAAFRVYDGWEGVFSDYAVYFFVMLSGFGAFFVLLTLINNRYLFSGCDSDEND